MRLLFLMFFFACTVFDASAQDSVAPVHALAMHGEPKYKADYTHFDYVNPDAPKGGTLKLGAMGGFDSFNPYIIKGSAADGMSLIYMTLTEHSADEAFSEYGGLAETMEMAPDRSWITFHIRPEAVWQDNVPVSADDVKWSFESLMKDGKPFYRAYYADVASVETPDAKTVKFIFKGTENRELPLILGQLPILPKHYWTDGTHNFSSTTPLEPPPGNGPYRIASFQPGRSIVYERVKNWWGEKLPPYKGRFNFDTITFDYYRDRDVILEAFLGGAYDFHQEYTAKLWATAYNTPAVQDGRIVKKEISHGLPAGMQGFVYNIRRPVFQNKNLRRALDYAFDFDFANKQFAYGAYKRTASYFENSEMAAPNHPPEGRVKEILESFKDQLPPDIFTSRYAPPKTDGSGNNRDNLRIAIKILDEAGYKSGKDGIRIDPKTGKALNFEILVDEGNGALERWVLPFIQNLKKIGVSATFRVIDQSQYINRTRDFDFDMTIETFGQSLSPGNEQRDYWKSDRADIPGSRNLIGLKDPVVDALVEMIVKANTRDELVAASQALDYALLAGHYVIPNWYIPSWRVAYWNHFDLPAVQAPYAIGYTDTWWEKEKGDHEKRAQ